MSDTLSTVVAARFRDLADTLTRNAGFLSTAGLPEIVAGVRARVYGDVAAQLRLLAEAEAVPAEGNPLVVEAGEGEIAAAVARRFGYVAGLLGANARLLTRRTAEAGLSRRAAVYRDVASQIRTLADAEMERAVLRPRAATRAPLSNTAPLSPVVTKAATRVPRVRPEFLESLVEAIARRRRQGWSVARLALWLRTALRDPQTEQVHPCAQRSFVAYVTDLLAGAEVSPRRARSLAA
ncbi:hypothetical protein AB0K15_34845 [Amycolatopsis sp. NPDC049253]|uniref:hypothetical protein n=1 Tax=Amycolatopsis sp. NPDC049253 TaxID=3155274 RepID=UPI00342AF710